MHDGEGRLAAEAVLFGRHTAECAEWFPGLVPASASLENSLRAKCAVALTGRRIKCGRPVLQRGQLESRGQERSRVRLLGLLEDALRRPCSTTRPSRMQLAQAFRRVRDRAAEIFVPLACITQTAWV